MNIPSSKRFEEFLHYWDSLVRQGKVSGFSGSEYESIKIYDEWLIKNEKTKEVMNK